MSTRIGCPYCPLFQNHAFAMNAAAPKGEKVLRPRRHGLGNADDDSDLPPVQPLGATAVTLPPRPSLRGIIIIWTECRACFPLVGVRESVQRLAWVWSQTHEDTSICSSSCCIPGSEWLQSVRPESRERTGMFTVSSDSPLDLCGMNWVASLAGDSRLRICGGRSSRADRINQPLLVCFG